MIKIIKPGTITELRCYKCGCLFSYEKEDIEIKKRIHQTLYLRNINI